MIFSCLMRIATNLSAVAAAELLNWATSWRCRWQKWTRSRSKSISDSPEKDLPLLAAQRTGRLRGEEETGSTRGTLYGTDRDGYRANVVNSQGISEIK